MRRAAAFALCCLAGLSGPLRAQLIKGLVVDEATGRPVDGVSVILLDSAGAVLDFTARSNGVGAFTLSAPGPGTYRLRGVRIGYQATSTTPFRIAEGELVNLRLSMAVLAQTLSPVKVVERRPLNNFELTSVLGFELRRSQLSSLSRAFLTGEALVERTNVADLAYNARAPWLRLTSTRQLSMQGCAGIETFLDGFPVRMDVITEMVLLDVYAVEVYRGDYSLPGHLAGFLPTGCFVAVWSTAAAARDPRLGSTRQHVYGRVLDAATGRPLARAEVALLSEFGNTRQSLRTDNLGRFTMTSEPSGRYRLRVGATTRGGAMTGVFELAHDVASAVELQVRTSSSSIVPLTVLGRRPIGPQILDDFDERRATGSGTFFTATDIEKDARATALDVLADVPGIRISRTRTNAPRIQFAAAGASGGSRPCTPAYYMNRVRLVSPLERATRQGAAAAAEAEGVSNVPDVVALLAASDVHGIEVYSTAAQVPPEFNDGAPCAAIVVWTKRGR